ncbi:type IVB secretion system protein IcmX [Legionella dresdenensis]|uniref:Type IVB secretion system protein IcmX n=1 Tax=Legionella dresdenensis TaxID=450200 RepID=A0ABV8CH45_9GAMM
MKFTAKKLATILLALSSTNFAATGGQASAGAGGAGGASPAAGGSSDDLTTYLKNLGSYLGYDITKYCPAGQQCPDAASGAGSGAGADAASGASSGSQAGQQQASSALFDANDAQNTQINALDSYIGALVGVTPQNTPMVSKDVTSYSLLNSLGGQTFNDPPYSTESSDGISVSSLIDQKTYRNDPVSQAILNIISTPNYTYCMDNDGKTQDDKCKFLYREKVMVNVLGDIQGTQAIFEPKSNGYVVPQLNSNTLLTPLLYSTDSSTGSNQGDSGSGSSGSGSSSNQGMEAKNQAQEAANFIRYVSGGIAPINLPNRQVYDDLMSKASNTTGNTAQDEQLKAQSKLLGFLSSLRIYAAQISVGISNLYYILSQRMPQSPVSGNGPKSSAALNEYIMATWRLYNPSAKGGGQSAGGGSASGSSGQNSQQWLNQINSGSAASVQKEIAILLAEINYQLYLSRQQQERLLLTQSILLLQNARASRPNADLSETSNQGN